MRNPRVLAVAVAAVLLGSSPAHAGGATLDGKKTKTLSFRFALSDPQAHPLAETIENDVDLAPSESCAKPRCYAVPFAVRPAKGLSARTPLSVKITWTLPTTRLWLQLMDVTKAPAVRTACFSFYVTAGRSATVRLDKVKPDRKYAVWVTVQQLAAPDTVSGVVAFPGKHTPASSPAPFPADLFVNGCNT